jgi:hypothetical protein
MVTEGGQNVILKMDPHAGPELALAFPTGELSKLILLAARGSTRARAAQGIDPAVKEAFAVEDWQLDLEPQDRVLVLSLTLSGGAELSFRLPLGIQQPLIDKLAATIAPRAAEPSQVN